MASLKKIEESLDQMISLMINMKKALNEAIAEEKSKATAALSVHLVDDFEQLKQIALSNKWPEAVNPNLICDPESEEDKKERGRGILELMITEDLKDKKILDFGCGQGHSIYLSAEYNVKLGVGYDIKSNANWSTFPQQPNILFTDNFELVKFHAPYDVIVLFDVIDHYVAENPISILNKCKEVLSDTGTIYMRCHPFTSKHALHLYHCLNKAYLHLVFTPAELQEIIPISEAKFYEPNNGPIYPLRTYDSYIQQAGLKQISRRDVVEEVDAFFKVPQIARRIIKITGMPEFPAFQMGLSFIDYNLKK